MNVFDIGGNVLLSDVPATPQCERVQELMRSDHVKFSWVSDKSEKIPAGSYVIYEGERFTLLDDYKPTPRTEREYHYQPQFESMVMEWGKVPFFMYNTDSEGNVTTKETDWSLTASPKVFLERVALALQNEVNETISISTEIGGSTTLQFASTDIFSALNSIAQAFNTEWWFDKKTSTLYLGECKHGESVTLKVGENVGIPSVTENSEGFYNRFYVFGSTRNIVQSYTGANVNNIANKRLTLNPAEFPNGYYEPYGPQAKVFSKVLVFDDIYPAATNLKIVDLAVRTAYVLDEKGNKKQIGTNSYRDPIYDQYTTWFFKPALENEDGSYSDFVFNDWNYSEDPNVENGLSGMKIMGLVPSVRFESGLLMGREFELSYYSKDTELSTAEGSMIVPAGFFGINYKKEGDYIIPDQFSLFPTEGDNIILFNIKMPDLYIEDAYARLKSAMVSTIDERYLSDQNQYTLHSYPHVLTDTLTIGNRVKYICNGYELETRITAIAHRLDYPSVKVLTIGNTLIKGTIQQLIDDTASANMNLEIMANLNAMTSSLANAYDRAHQSMLETLNILGSLFEIDEDGNLKTTMGLYSTKFISSRGADPNRGGGGTGGGSSYLNELLDVNANPIDLKTGDMLVWDKTSQKYVVINKSVFALASSLNEYQKKVSSSNKIPYAYISGVPTALKNPYALTIAGKAYDGSGEVSITAEDLGAITDLSNYYTKREVDALIPSLAGYATQSWVEGKKYLTAITSAMVTSALGYTPYSTSNPNGYTSNKGTVTSVKMTVPTGFSVSGSPITSEGTLALTFANGYSLPTTAKQANWDTAYGWGNHASKGYATETFVNTAIANLINGAPTTLDTLKEIADALADNADVVEALESAIGTKADKTTVDALDTRLDTAEANISTNTTNITSQGKTIASHTTSINTLSSDVSGLKTSVSDLEDLFDSDGKALKAVTADNATKLNGQAASYYATAASVKSVSDSLANYALKTRKISAGTGLSGGGDLTADRTLALATSGVTAGTYTKTTVDAYGRVTSGTTLSASDIPALAISKIANLQTTLDGLRTDVDNALGDAGDNAAAIVTLSGNLSKLTTRVSTAETNITNLTNNKLNKSVWDSVFEIDGNGNLKVKVGLYSTSFISARGSDANAGGGGGGGAFSLYTWAQVKALTSEVGGVAPTAYALKQAYNEIGVSLDGKASTSSVTALTTRVASLESKATSVSVSQTLTTGTEIGKITIDGVSKALYAPSSIAWGSVTGKPSFATVATSGKYSDLSGLPTIPSIAGLASETWVGSNYLPLSGGTLTGTGNYPLIIKAGGTAYSAIRLMTSAGDFINFGYRYAASDTIPKMFFTNKNGWSREYILLHDDNYSSYALKLDASNARATKLTSSESLDNYQYGFYSYTNGNNPTNSFGDNTALFAFASNRGNDIWQIAFDGNGITQTIGPRFGIRGNYAGQGWTSWYRIATTDSTVASAYKLVTSAGADAATIGSNGLELHSGFVGYKDGDAYRYLGPQGSQKKLRFYDSTEWKDIAFTDSNVASATKLQTARTIWGQSFDGTGNVSGTLYLPNNIAIASANASGTNKPILRFNSSNVLVLGEGTSTSGYNTAIQGNNVYLQYGTSNTNGLILNSNGNVLIGTSTDLGYKLDVMGSTHLQAYNGDGSRVLIGPAAFGTKIEARGNGNTYFQSQRFDGTTAYYNIVLQELGGNVGIGTTDPKYKLEVAGSFAVGTETASSIVLRRSNYHSYIIGASSLAFCTNNNSNNIALELWADKSTTFLGAVTMNSTLAATGTIYSATGVYSAGYVSARGADSSSDRRLKDNIAPLRNALAYVLGTNYVSFDWKDTREKSIGIIAQEEMGREWGCLVQKHSETYSYLYGQHTALLGAAIQEEDKKVEELKAEISRLKAKVNELETRLYS